MLPNPQLVRTGAEQAIRSAEQTETDILKGKKCQRSSTTEKFTSRLKNFTYDQMTGPV